MAIGRMEFHAESIMQHTFFSFVLPNDTAMEEVRDKRHYARPPKTLILLHGLTGTDTDWITRGVAQELSIQYNLAVFMPTAGNAFYLDRGYRGGNYASYVGEELPRFIRSVFGYAQRREDTMIGGLSMGGFGAVHTALQFPETFSKCVALSSALVMYELAEPGEKKEGVMPAGLVREVFGEKENVLESDLNPEFLYRRAKAAGKPLPGIYLAIGTEDDLYACNQRFRRFLTAEGADFRYEDGPGRHDWPFWNEYLDRGLAWTLRDDEPQPDARTLRGMSARELFSVLTGERGIVQQTLLKNMILAYKEKHPTRAGQPGGLDLQAIVGEMAEKP